MVVEGEVICSDIRKRCCAKISFNHHFNSFTPQHLPLRNLGLWKVVDLCDYQRPIAVEKNVPRGLNGFWLCDQHSKTTGTLEPFGILLNHSKYEICKLQKNTRKVIVGIQCLVCESNSVGVQRLGKYKVNERPFLSNYGILGVTVIA